MIFPYRFLRANTCISPVISKEMCPLHNSKECTSTTSKRNKATRINNQTKTPNRNSNPIINPACNNPARHTCLKPTTTATRSPNRKPSTSPSKPFGNERHPTTPAWFLTRWHPGCPSGPSTPKPSNNKNYSNSNNSSERNNCNNSTWWEWTDLHHQTTKPLPVWCMECNPGTLDKLQLWGECHISQCHLLVISSKPP